MKIKVLSLDTKTALATGAYYLAIVALLVLLGAIVLRFVFAPPCSIIGKNECVVDGWSVAGLAGTVLAVAATLLAILGAVAVAAWWTGLNDKVDRRVNEQIATAIDQALKEQAEKINDQTTRLLKEQETKFEGVSSNIRKDVDALKELASDIERRLQSTKKDLIIAMTQLDPWMIEPWASEEMFLNPLSEVGVRMVRKYLQYVDAFFPNEPRSATAIEKYGENLDKISAPFVTPISYWEYALAWRERIKPELYPNQAQVAQYAQVAEHEIEQRRPLIEAWKKQQGL